MYDNRKRLVTIECPVCNTSYLPAEIFLPNSFLGKPYDIEKTSTGKIDMFDGTTMDTYEEYVCDKCHKKFKVFANVSFKTEEINSNKTFNTIYSTPLHSKKISLFEG